MNALRTSILLLMLYLIFAREITVGQFFSLWIYSFFTFGPLQELGNVINVYREAEVSLGRFERILKTPKAARPVDPVRIDELICTLFDVGREGNLNFLIIRPRSRVGGARRG